MDIPRETQLNELFDLIDTDKSGVIEDVEMYAMIRLVHPKTTYQQCKDMFAKVDTDMGNSIDKKEFCKHFLEQHKDADAKGFAKTIKKTVKFVTRKPALAALFAHFDVNKDGNLDIGEMYHMIKLSKSKVTMEELKELVDEIDTNHDHKVDVDEFVHYFFFCFQLDNDEEFAHRMDISMRGLRVVKLNQVFDSYDRDGNGVLDVNEFSAMLRHNGRKHVDAETVLDTLVKFDSNGDRKVDFKEFLAHMATMVALMDDKTFAKAVKNMLKGTPADKSDSKK